LTHFPNSCTQFFETKEEDETGLFKNIISKLGFLSMSVKYLFFAVFIIVAILFLVDFIKNYRSYKNKEKEEGKTK